VTTEGRFEWIIDTVGSLTGCVSHRFFVKGGKLNGVRAIVTISHFLFHYLDGWDIFWEVRQDERN